MSAGAECVQHHLEALELTDPEREVKANALKDDGNNFFKQGHFDEAIKSYSAAILVRPTAVFYANRSQAYLKKELFGLALEDAGKAIELDKNYVKAYFRRASANMALGKFQKALRDYEAVVTVFPNDVDTKKRRDVCRKHVNKIKFEKAISMDHSKKPLTEMISLESYEVEASYDGPRLDGPITLEFMKELIATFKRQGKLHIKYAFKMLLDIYAFFKEQPNMIEIDVPKDQEFTVCGDIHGQFYDLCNIFELRGLPSETNPFLFNGDFVDRGSFSVETIFTMFGFKLLYPNHFFLSRGNHESDVMNKMYGFEGEVKAKFNGLMCEFFTEIFCHLPLCHLLNRQLFVAHGGLFSEDDVTFNDIQKVDRVRQPPDSGIMCDLLWADPMDSLGRAPSKRGVSYQFGPDVTERWCELNNVQYVIRSHEVKPEGWEEQIGGRCFTLFSAPNYCDTVGNMGAYAVVSGKNMKPRFVSFKSVPHPAIPAMKYASSLFGL